MIDVALSIFALVAGGVTLELFTAPRVSPTGAPALPVEDFLLDNPS